MKKKIIIITFVVAGSLLLIGTGTIYASNDAVPGDFTYTFDKTGESLYRLVTFGEEDKADLEMDILDERLEELKELESDENENVGNAIKNLEKQQKRVEEGVRGNVSDKKQQKNEEQERIQNRYKEQSQEHLKAVEKIQTNFQKQGNNEVAQSMKGSIEKYQNGTSSN